MNAGVPIEDFDHAGMKYFVIPAILSLTISRFRPAAKLLECRPFHANW